MTIITKDSKETFQNPKKYGLGVRHIQCLAIFIGISIAYSLRVNLNIGIVAMTDKGSENPDVQIFDWGEKTKSMILSSFYWGYIVNQVPGGHLSTRYGSKFLLLCGILGASIFTTLTPIVVSIGNWQALLALRICEGLSQGMLFPSVHSFIAQWVPVEERPRLGMFCYSGVTFGTAVMLAVSGSIASSTLGWPGIFYISGSMGILWSIVWLLIGSSRPSEHKTISKEELQYIQTSLGLSEDSHKKHIPTPWLLIFRSKPFWALLVAIMSNGWGFIVLLAEIPTYMHAVLEVDIKKNGIMSSLPYFAMLVLSYVFVFIGDILYNKEVMSVSKLRKFFNTIGTCVPACALIGLAFVTKSNTTIAVITLIIAVGFNAAAGIGSSLNHIDLAPNHAGIMMGITNGMGAGISIISPLVVGLIVKDEHNQSLWQIVFFISAGIFIVGNLIFVLFGSAEEQDWNDPIAIKKLPNSTVQRRSSAFLEAASSNY